jgi:peptidoglycan hydrolase-like protein with peptidoglycan-binding domain
LSIYRIARRPIIALTAVGAIFVVAAGVMVAVTAAGRHARPVAATSVTARTSHKVTASGGQGAAADGGPANPPSRARQGRPVRPLRVTAVTPTPGATGVNGADPVRVTFSAPVAAGSPMPVLSPAIPGRWAAQGDSAVFTPVTGFGPGTPVTVTVPTGRSGVRGSDGAVLTAAPSSYRYTVGSYSTLRLQQLLAQLGYLPLKWEGHLGDPVPADAVLGYLPMNWGGDLGDPVPADAARELGAAYQPPPGVFTWRRGYPASLMSLWREGSANLIDTGAIMAFEADNGLAMDGVAGPEVWAALLRAAVDGRDSLHGYTYALASKTVPETLTIWHDGRRVFHSLANTGIPLAPTADGTFPVYERLRYQVMTGINPDGTRYADPVQYVAYFNGGEAVHYFPRYSYGWPQSLGCVELPLDAAATAWPYLSYGSLVTVSPPVSP